MISDTLNSTSDVNIKKKKNEVIMFFLLLWMKWNTYIKCHMIQDRLRDYSRMKISGHRPQNNFHN